MCLAAWSVQQNERFPWVLASNRDEFFARSTASLGWWRPSEGSPEILSGRDLEAGGSWLGLQQHPERGAAADSVTRGGAY